MIVKRGTIPNEDKWNVEALYENFQEWQGEFTHSFSEERPRWPELGKYKGKLSEGSSVLKEAFECFFSIERKLTKLYTYAHLRHDEDIVDDQFKSANQQVAGIYYEFIQESSWLEPELLSLSDDLIEKYLDSDELSAYRFHIEKIMRMKKHTLSPENERLLALSGQALRTAQKSFSALSDADFKFGKVTDSEGSEKEITHALYGLYLRDHDRLLRERAFKQYHKKYREYENTIGELLQGQVQCHVFNARARQYSSCLEAALYPHNINLDVYHSLIQAVNDNLDAHHRYIALRKRALNVSELHLYDMYVPLTSDIDIKMSVDEAMDVIIESVSPLGVEYQNVVRQGFKQDRWVDRFENENKRSGAYSSGCYDSMPYILMNYKNILRDVFTLSHELGHSMHSYLSHERQPYHYSNYPIFLAEVASTFNEDLLTRLMVEKAQSREEKIYLINQKIEDIRATLFRQTMFAEFELNIHEMVEKNIPLTPTLLKEEYQKLNTKYFGTEVVIDPEISIEWARIPHFYYNFYVYQYATGISAAFALSERVIKGGSQECDDYLTFLKGGSSQYPIDLLKVAGVDIRTPEPVNAAINKFRHLVDELDGLLSVSEVSS